MIATTTPGRRTRRPAATLVESAFVISIFLLFVFGIFEYSRYLVFLHVATNAIRDAGRYASVNVDKPSNFTTVPFVTGSTTYLSITDYAKLRMASSDTWMDAGYTIEIYPCDATQLAQTPPVIARKQVALVGGGSRNAEWNEASFTERICVKLSGTYRMALPSFLYAAPAIPVRISAVVGSEG